MGRYRMMCIHVCRNSRASGSQRLEAEPHCDQAGDRGLGSLERRRRREPVRGRPQFTNLLFRRGNPPCFFAFDLLTYGKDLRTERLLDRKQELRRLLARSPDSRLKYTDHVDGSRDSVISASLRIGLGGHCCQAEICTLRHRPRAKYVVQDFESEIFTEGRQRGIV